LKISLSSSNSADGESTLLVIEIGISIRTDGIRQLTAADNYQIWVMQIEYLLISIDAKKIVLENLQPLNDFTAEELQLY
jgi:hypothetical protein